MVKRVLLFSLTNILIMVTFSVICSVTGLGQHLTSSGMNYTSLAVFCLIWGMGFSFVSLLISKWMAKTMYGVQVIDPQAPGQYQYLLDMVHNAAQQAGLSKMPEVGIYNSPETNAFATGPSKNNSIVAFSSGILGQMNKTELEGVAGHEVAHIKNGDMVTMTLIQGVMNAFVMFAARVLANIIASRIGRDNSYFVRLGIIIALEILFGMLAMVVVSWFSRKREFRADADSAKYVGKEKMIAGLESLARKMRVDDSNEALATLKIGGVKKSGWKQWFSTHPPLEERIAALRSLNSLS